MMSTLVVVVEHRSDWKEGYPQVDVVTAREYLGDPALFKRGCRVTNLCRSYGYLSVGYYVSLLAEARRHKVIPTVRTISELSRKSIYSLEITGLDTLIQRSFRRNPERKFELLIQFGQCGHADLDDLARQIHDLFPCPLLRVEFALQDDKWRITRIRPHYLNALDPLQQRAFMERLERHLARRWRKPRARNVPMYDIAVLVDPGNPLPPSDKGALGKFIRVGKRMGLALELIEKRDYPRLAEYDALFIRETTRIDHYTYRFARKAESEGMVVIDDPDSILKCTNKVYLAELLQANRVPAPRMRIVQEDGLMRLADDFSWPIVLKIPDGSFSRGVFKASSAEELKEIGGKLLRESDLILAQEYMYTEFDWRIGILDNRAIYACKYFMSGKHWQVLEHGESGRIREGRWETLPAGEAPEAVINAALKAARLIGDGLYGVDVKETARGAFVIEVNDNPNLESGVEDASLGDELYRIVLEGFKRRLEGRRPG